MPRKVPTAKELGIPAKTEVGYQMQKSLLRKIAGDDRLTPSKRILCTMLLGYLDGVYPFSIIEDVFGNPNRIKWSGNRDVEDDKEALQADRVNMDAADDIRTIYKEFGNAAAGNSESQ